MEAMLGPSFAVYIGRGEGLDWISMGGPDAVEMIWLRLVEVFVITTEMADALACSGDEECRLVRRSVSLEMAESDGLAYSIDVDRLDGVRLLR
jgi:hypothetical protein